MFDTPISSSENLLTKTSRKLLLSGLKPSLHQQCLYLSLCLCKEKVFRHYTPFITVTHRQRWQTRRTGRQWVEMDNAKNTNKGFKNDFYTTLILLYLQPLWCVMEYRVQSSLTLRYVSICFCICYNVWVWLRERKLQFVTKTQYVKLPS